MHRVFCTFIESLTESVDAQDLRESFAQVSEAFDLPCFAYLSLPSRSGTEVKLLSTYPSEWTSHYLRQNYERLDPVIQHALMYTGPFEWGPEFEVAKTSKMHRRFFDEAAQFGIRYGLTVPIHDGRCGIAALTYAVDEPAPAFRRCVEKKAEVLQLLAILFHAKASRVLGCDRTVAGITLSARQLECLEWAARGKSASDIGCILNISPRTVVFHIENAKARLGVRTIAQAVALLAASKPFMR
jgi:DNA-binding CsgD family transcriptional regulator